MLDKKHILASSTSLVTLADADSVPASITDSEDDDEVFTTNPAPKAVPRMAASNSKDGLAKMAMNNQRWG